MKRILLLQLFLFTAFGFAQVGVNTATPDPSSVLDVTSTNKGALFPRVSLSNINLTTLDGTNTSATGLLIWNTNPATTGGNGVGYYFFNGTIWIPIMQNLSTDHDWYEVGGTNPPNAITDNKYSQGSVTIGTNSAATGILDIDNTTKATSLDINNTFATNPTGIDVVIASNNSSKTGIKATFSGASATGNNNFISNIDNTTGNNNRTGILQEFNGASASIATTIRGVKNDFKSTASYYAVIYGFENSFADNTNSFKYGLTNNFLNGGTSQSTGVLNNFNGTSTGIAYGINNSSNNYSGQLNGLYNIFSGTGDNEHYGVYNFLNGTGSGDKYGIYTLSPTTAGGTHYGIYANILKPGSFAGYFLGNVSIGTTIANNYILPPSRGTNGQIMQTDGTGNVSWVTPVVTTDTDNQIIDVLTLTGDTLNISLQDDAVATQTLNLSAIDNQATDVFSLTGTTLNLSLQNDGVATQTVNLSTLDTDDQATDVFSLTGNTLNLSLQNDGVATQTVDLSSLKDADWFEVGGTNSPDAITDDKFTFGNLSIGKATASTAKVDIDAVSKLHTLYLLNTNINPGTKVGINNQLFTDDTNGASMGIINGLSGNANFKTAIQNNLTGNYTVGSNFEYAINNTLNSTGNISTFGINNMFSPSIATSGSFYGMNNQINGTNHDGLFFGMRNTTGTTTNFAQYGVLNNFGGGGSGIRYGLSNTFSGSMSGDVFGIETTISGTGTGTKFGERITISDVSGGQHFGIFADVTKANSFAGYFLGRVAIGNTLANTYILPPSRGTNNQIMQTDGAGNVSWTDVPSDADWFEVGGTGTTPANSILDNIYTGGDVSIGKATAAIAKLDIDANSKLNTLYLENSNATAGTKSGIQNVVTSNINNTFSSGIQNNVTGLGSLKYGVTNLFATNNTGSTINEMGFHNFFQSSGNTTLFGAYNFFSPSSTNIAPIVGHANTLVGNNHSGEYIGYYNSIANDNINNNQLGLSNSFTGSGNGNRYGINNSIGGTVNGDVFGVKTEIVSTGTGTKYGESITIDNTIPGIHFGFFADVTKANSYAGYFLGRVSVGTTAANSYIFPTSRGTNGQIMQTDGAGNLSWIGANAISWSLTGNAGTTAGINFIGTTDAQDLDFRTNNQLKLRITQQGQLSFLNSGASVFIGALAGDTDDLTNNQNTFVGSGSGQLNTTGSLNTAIGHASLNINDSGIGNTAIGKSALITNDLGSNNTAVGRLADVATGSLTNTSAIGFGATVNASNKIRLGNAAITVVEGQVAYTNPSDARFKFNIQENVPGLDFIKKLKPVTYNFDTKKFDNHLNQKRNKNEIVSEDFSKSTAIVRTGFLAQDVEKICADLGYDFDGLHIPDANNPTDNYGIAYSQFIMPIVKAVQEQQLIIETQKTELEQVKSELEKYKQLEARIKALEQK